MKHLLLLLALVACTQPKAVPDVMRPSVGRQVRALVSPTPIQRGCIREFGTFTSTCRWAGPNPVVAGPRTEPRVGTPIVIRWSIGWLGPVGTVTPNGESVAPLPIMLVSLRPLATPIDFAGAPGCRLLVNPDHVFVPPPEGWLRYDAAKQVVTLDWTPEPGLEGSDFYMQLLVAIPQANPLGYVSSQGLKITIGAEF